MSDVQFCSTCGKKNPAHALHCYACGQVLPYNLHALSTHTLHKVPATPPKTPIHGTGLISERVGLALWAKEIATPITFWFDTECILGRTTDPNNSKTIDLSSLQALEAGVSRQHARLIRNDSMVFVQDLGSTNGTFLNGQQLLPDKKRILRNRDILQLGLLVLRVSFLRS